jgi:type IV pilus assembly protein PilM
MFDRFLTDYALGIQLDSNTLRVAKVSYSKNKAQIEKLQTLPIKWEEGELVKPVYIGESLQQEPDVIISTGLHTNEVLIRPLDVKLTKESEIESVLPFQAETILPYPTENALLSSVKLSQTADSTLLTLIAARKDHLVKLLSQLDHLEINPEDISCIPTALTAFTYEFGDHKDPRAIFTIYIGESETTCILSKEGRLIGAHAVPFQSSQLASNEGKENLKLELMRCIYALAKLNKNQSLTEVILTGTSPALLDFGNLLTSGLKIPVRTPPATGSFSSQQLQEYAPAIGYALSVLPGSQQNVNFRQQEFAYPQPWKKLKKPIILYGIASLLAASLLLVFGNSWIGYKEDNVRTEFVDLLKTLDKPYPEFENAYLKKNGLPPETESQVTPIKSLSMSDLEGRVQALETEIQATPDIFPLQPNTPRVSDLLAWLGMHPNVVKPTDGKKPAAPLIEFETITYSMVKRPQQGKKNEKYQVKVDLEFSAPTPKIAREFHDALMAPNDYVDPKGEIKWSAGKDSYRASFYLKDRTVYLPSGGS